MTVETTRLSRDERARTLALAGAAFVLVLICWQTGLLSGVLYPMRLFVSLVHELGHGLTAILTGGRFIKFEVFPNGAGLATTAGGSPFLVPQMGYLGAALFGSVLLVLTNRVSRVRYVAYAVAALIGGCVLMFTGSGGSLLIGLIVGGVAAWLIADRLVRYQMPLRLVAGACAALILALIWSNVALRIGLIGAALLIALGTFGSRPVTTFVLNFLALVVGLNAIMDIWGLLGSLNASLGDIPNDAAAVARYTGTPTAFWVILWLIVVAGMMGAAFYVAFVQPLRKPYSVSV